MNHLLLSVSIITCLTLLEFSCSAVSMNLKTGMLPEKIGKWNTGSPWKTFRGSDLYMHINGEAELYLSYSFKKVHVKKYTAEDESSISLEIYDMGNSRDAYGIFSVEKDDKDIGIGQGSEYGGGILRFWKGKYYVSITTTAPETEVDQYIILLAKTVESGIKQEGPKPELLSTIPTEGLRKTLYFHKLQILNRKYFLSNKNILMLNSKTECILGEYRFSSGTLYLLRVKYPDMAASKKAYNLFRTSYMPDAGNTDYLKVEDGKWTLVDNYHDYISIVFDAPDRDSGEQLLLKKFFKR